LQESNKNKNTENTSFQLQVNFMFVLECVLAAGFDPMGTLEYGKGRRGGSAICGQ